MKVLKPNWITNGLIDYEYKKYELLAYLQGIQSQFIQNKLYPYLSDLVGHYNNVVELKASKHNWANQFPKTLDKINLKKGKLIYRPENKDTPLLDEISSILSFAQDEIKSVVKDGADIYEYVEQNVDISPIGLIPLNSDEGYIFLHQQTSKKYNVYRYTMTIFEESKENFRGMRTSFIKTEYYSRFVTLESEKINLTKQFSSLPNPAVFYITTDMKFPEKETLFPVAKRYLIRYLSEIE